MVGDECIGTMEVLSGELPNQFELGYVRRFLIGLKKPETFSDQLRRRDQAAREQKRRKERQVE